MATMYCSICRHTAVRKAGETCAGCKYKLSHPDEFPAMAGRGEAPVVAAADVDVAQLLRVGLAQAQEQQQRLQDALEGNGAFQGDTLNEMTKLVRVLETLVQLEITLRKAARTKVQSNDERIDAMVTWAREALPKAKLERLKTLVAEL
jgi:Fic family protein